MIRVPASNLNCLMKHLSLNKSRLCREQLIKEVEQNDYAKKLLNVKSTPYKDLENLTQPSVKKPDLIEMKHKHKKVDIIDVFLPGLPYAVSQAWLDRFTCRYGDLPMVWMINLQGELPVNIVCQNPTQIGWQW